MRVSGQLQRYAECGGLSCSSRLMVQQDDRDTLRRAFQSGSEVSRGMPGMGRRQIGDAGENQRTRPRTAVLRYFPVCS